MKKTITLALILVLTVCLLAGCRGGANPEDMATDASQAMDRMISGNDNGRATDGDGFIGGGNHPKANNGAGRVMPNDF